MTGRLKKIWKIKLIKLRRKKNKRKKWGMEVKRKLEHQSGRFNI